MFAGSVPFLKLAGTVCGGWQMARAAECATRLKSAGGCDSPGFYQAKIATARFYADHSLPLAIAFQHAITEGGTAATLLAEELF